MNTASPDACSALASAAEMRGTAALAAATIAFTVVGMASFSLGCGPASLAQRIPQDEAKQRRAGGAEKP